MKHEQPIKAFHKPTKRTFPVYSILFSEKEVFEDSLDGVGTRPTLPAKLDDCEILYPINYKDETGKEIYEGDIVLGISDGTYDNGTFPHDYDEEKDDYLPCGKYAVRWSDNFKGYNLWDIENECWLECEWNIFTSNPTLRIIGNEYEEKR